ncbi:ornithine cyclodeaminase family protein [Microvirga massiliensis]|uniref:ornithine cyclodeaminase family protein n=1 Tax=Microvirga massiliensis TaxID=1033741 RepID=UPI00062BE861|nr:ornithine cyclodeaminase family protein [Microvirga massiliensis]
MRVITASEIDAALTFESLIEAVKEAFLGDVVVPARHHHDMEQPAGATATLLLMPAWTGATSPEGFIGVKVLSVFPDNGARGLPSIQGTYILLDGRTGVPHAALDGSRLTVWRTAAASALAARHLAHPEASRMVMVGAGALAPFLIRAHRSQRPIRDVKLWNHRPERAVALAAQLAAEGLPVAATEDLETAVREADLVSCATLSGVPIVKGAWLKEGAHLDLVGAFSPRMREADDHALQRSEVYVDTPVALSEGGDVALALASGAIDRDHVRGTLVDLCREGGVRNRAPGAITVFKSVGAAIEDLAAAQLVWRQISGVA